ncbi:hypothetical protein LTS06_011117, partial [Exophiala xenobiotica]
AVHAGTIETDHVRDCATCEYRTHGEPDGHKNYPDYVIGARGLMGTSLELVAMLWRGILDDHIKRVEGT